MSQFLSRIYLFAVLMVLVACNASAPSPSSPRAASAATPAFVPPDLSLIRDVAKVQSIHILDQWDGLSPAAPIEAEYFIEPNDSEFGGWVKFGVGRQAKRQDTNESIRVPMNVVSEFVQLLADSPLDDIVFKPVPTMTDNYPFISITIVASGGKAEFFTTSQYADYIPWRVRSKGLGAMINTNNPARALELLAPHLKKDVLQKMIDSALHR